MDHAVLLLQPVQSYLTGALTLSSLDHWEVRLRISSVTESVLQQRKDGALVKVFVLFKVAALQMMRGILGVPL
eukprot:5371973-Ditylum_brightwellii.AAC.1